MREVEIHDFVLRLPGMTREEARAVAEDIGRRIADAVPEWRESDLAELAAVRVRLPAGASSDEIARRVAAEITRMLR
jgi:hypothetical protein